MGFASNISEKISHQENQVSYVLKPFAFTVTANSKPHLALRFPQKTIIHVSSSIKPLREKTFAFSRDEPFGAGSLQVFAQPVGAPYSLCQVRAARALGAFTPMAKCTHTPGKSDD